MTDEGLEFQVGRAGLVVPGPFVDRVVEVTPTPLPPIGPGWLRGLAFVGTRLVLIVGLSPRKPGPPEAHKGVLLRTDPREAGWVLEAQSIGRFIAVNRIAETTPRNDKLPAWIARAKTADARLVGWIDVPAMLGSLGGLRAAPATQAEER